MLVRSTSLAALLLVAGFTDAAEPKKDGGLPPLPKPVASFGAAAWDGYLYVYGGHAGKTHSYDNESVLGTFHRIKIDGGTHWEELPGGPRAQGMNLVAHDGKIYRVGGMQPKNKPGEPADNHSLADAARFDVKTGKWEELPALPAGRSSHDIAIAGDKLVVVGGWQMKGSEKSVWHDTVLLLDTKAKDAKWESAPQPFQRRALTAAAVGTKVYVLGGLGADGKPTDIFDVATKKWSQGPSLPLEGKKAMAFSPSAATVDGRIVVNTVAGPFYRLTKEGDGWEKVGAAASPRMVARLVTTGERSVLLVGGASQSAGGMVSTIEAVKLAEKGEPVKPAEPKPVEKPAK